MIKLTLCCFAPLVNTCGCQAPKSAKFKERLVSLDGVRGLTVAIMILVDNLGVYTKTNQIQPHALTHSTYLNACHTRGSVHPWLYTTAGLPSVTNHVSV